MFAIITVTRSIQLVKFPNQKSATCQYQLILIMHFISFTITRKPEHLYS